MRVSLGVLVAVLTYTFMPVDEMVRGITVMLFLTPASNILIRYSILFGYPPNLAGSLVNASTGRCLRAINVFVLKYNASTSNYHRELTQLPF